MIDVTMTKSKGEAVVCDESPLPLVSVVMPVRNGWPYLSSAVESILAQSYANFEFLVVDDGSTDEGREWLSKRALEDLRLRILFNPGMGLVDALNYGLAQACGTYVARMDADDISMPERFERQVAFLMANQSVAALGTQATTIDNNGRLLGSISLPTDAFHLSEFLVSKGCALVHPTIMARRDAVMQVGGYRRCVEFAEDYDLWLRLDERFSLANLSDMLLYYRRHPKQISNGVNWQQRFARDIALMSARARRSGFLDPLENIEGLLFDNCGFNLTGRHSNDQLEKICHAYWAVRLLVEGSGLSDLRQMQSVIDAARGGYFGDGSKLRCQIAARIAWLSFKTFNWSLAVQGALLAISIAPGRTVSSVLGISAQDKLKW